MLIGSKTNYFLKQEDLGNGLTRMLLYMLPFSTSRLTLMMQQSSTCWLYSGSDRVE